MPKSDEPMTLDRMIGILQGVRAQVGGGAFVHVVVDDDAGTPIPYDIVDFEVKRYPEVGSAVRLLACQI